MYFHYDKRDPRPVLDVEVKLAAMSGKHPPWQTDPDTAIKVIAEHCRVILKDDLDTYTQVQVRFEDTGGGSLVVFLNVICAVTDKVLSFFQNERTKLVEANIQNQLGLHFGRSSTNVNVSMTPDPNFALSLPGYLRQVKGSNDIVVRETPPQPAQAGGAVAVAPVVVTIPTGSPAQAPVAKLPGAPGDPVERGHNGGFFPALAIAVLALVVAAVLWPKVDTMETKIEDLLRRMQDVEQYQQFLKWRDDSDQDRRRRAPRDPENSENPPPPPSAAPSEAPPKSGKPKPGRDTEDTF